MLMRCAGIALVYQELTGGQRGGRIVILIRACCDCRYPPAGLYAIFFRYCEERSDAAIHTEYRQARWIATSRRVGIRNDEVGLQPEKKDDFDGDFDFDEEKRRYKPYSWKGASVAFSHESRQLGTWWDAAIHTEYRQARWIATSRRVGIRNDEGGLQTEKKHDFDGDFDFEKEKRR
jgi:hypothetical protein